METRNSKRAINMKGREGLAGVSRKGSGRRAWFYMHSLNLHFEGLINQQMVAKVS